MSKYDKNEFICKLATISVDTQSKILKLIEEFEKSDLGERIIIKKTSGDIKKQDEELRTRENIIIKKELILEEKLKKLSYNNNKLLMEKHRLDTKKKEIEHQLLNELEKRFIIDAINYAIAKSYGNTDSLNNLKISVKEIKDVFRKLGLSEDRIKNIDI